MTGDEFLQRTADLNRQVLDLAGETHAAAQRAIISGDYNQVVTAYRDTLGLLDAIVQDLTESRAEGAAIYATDPEFRRAVDETTARNV